MGEQTTEIAHVHGPAVEHAHAPWCTPDNPCAGGLCDGSRERFIRHEGDRHMTNTPEREHVVSDAEECWFGPTVISIPNAQPQHSHSAADACRRPCPAYGNMLMEKTAARLDVPQAQNDRGEWVPAIPEPMFVGFLLRKARCDCGATFRSRLRYREHFALAHTLGLL